MMGWKVPTYVVEPEESYVLYKFISFPTPEFKSLKLIVSHIKLKKYRHSSIYAVNMGTQIKTAEAKTA